MGRGFRLIFATSLLLILLGLCFFLDSSSGCLSLFLFSFFIRLWDSMLMIYHMFQLRLFVSEPDFYHFALII